ncbi:hypothetical protein AVEN_190980-1 [Araneus ventricosus]|uniref:Uncharacterized protein n=1 Tax=Araneus ventricosus TaxID=182803 RepID=A0A4Y2WU19_ARAVE|nr:hypothetical protein AVEN_190980-1 [Araneus ventricosus]
MLKLGIGARYYLLRNGKKDGIIQQRDHGLRNFSVTFNRLYGYFYYNQALTSHGVFGAHQERLFGKEGGCPCGEQLETIEPILLKCKIWGKEKEDWPKSWLQKDISDLVFYSPFEQDAIVILKKLMSSRLEEGGGLRTAGESSKSSDMLYSKASSSDAKEELISASASDSRDCKILFSNGGRTAIGKSSMSTEVGLAITEGFNADLWVEILSFVVIELGLVWLCGV